MKKCRNITTDIIMREYKMEQKHKKDGKKAETLAQFQLNHCRKCKNKDKYLCEIRKTMEDTFSCIYEDSI